MTPVLTLAFSLAESGQLADAAPAVCAQPAVVSVRFATPLTCHSLSPTGWEGAGVRVGRHH